LTEVLINNADISEVNSLTSSVTKIASDIAILYHAYVIIKNLILNKATQQE